MSAASTAKPSKPIKKAKSVKKPLPIEGFAHLIADMLNELSARDRQAVIKFLEYEVQVKPQRPGKSEVSLVTHTGKLSMLRLINGIVQAIDGEPRNIGPIMMRLSPDKSQPVFTVRRFVFNKD